MAFISLLLAPAIQQCGPAGGQVMAALERGGLMTFMPVLGGTTVLSGLWQYWRFTGGFDPVVSQNHAGWAFGIGGVAGLAAAIIGGSVVGRSSDRISALAKQASSMSDGQERATVLESMAHHQQRAASGSRIVLVLLVIATALMALGHYV